MNAIRVLGILVASLALIGVAEAQKGGGKPGGGGGGTTPPPPYTPVIVDVVCDGTGTKLQDVLNGLNPYANAYEVRVSGVCPEKINIDGFQKLTLASADAGSRATVGAIYVYTTAQNVLLDKLIVVNKTSRANLISNSNRTDANDLELRCERPDGQTCEGVRIWRGISYLWGLKFVGSSWDDSSKYLSVAEYANVWLINHTEENNTFEGARICSEFKRVNAWALSKVHVKQGENCGDIQLNSWGDLDVWLMDGSTASVWVYDQGRLSISDLTYSRSESAEPRPLEHLAPSLWCGQFAVLINPDLNDYSNRCPQ